MAAPDHGGFITLEGGEGTGKSTQSGRLAERLASLGVETVLTREPGGSPRAETIRTALLSGAVAPLGPKAEALMFAAARLDHVETRIRPALDRGAFVICDRFLDSTRVYQGELGSLDPALIRSLERAVVGGLLPQLTLVLDLPAEIGLRRARGRGGPGSSSDRFEREGEEFHERLRQAFLSLARREPERCRIVDAEQPPDRVADTIWASVLSRFPHLSSRPEKGRVGPA